MSTPTPTPETDAAVQKCHGMSGEFFDVSLPTRLVTADFARSLERRLAESQAACATMREALRGSQHAMTLAKPIVLRASVASCNCMTKTNALQYHSESCRYRQAEEANDAITAKIEHAGRALQPTAGAELLAQLQRERELADRLAGAFDGDPEEIRKALAEWREARK